MDESSSQASVKARLDAAEEKRRAASDAILGVKNGERDFRACMNALVAAQDELDELKREYEPYERQDAEARFTAHSTVPKILKQVKQLRDELGSVDTARINAAREKATDFAIGNLWKMMRRIGGKPVPSQPLWAIDDGCSPRAQAALRALSAPPIAETPEVHAALDAVEQWCAGVEASPSAIISLEALQNWISSNLKKGELKASEFILKHGGTASLKDISMHMEWTRSYDDAAGGLCRRVSGKLKEAGLRYKLHRSNNCLKFSTVESTSKRKRTAKGSNKTTLKHGDNRGREKA